MAIVYTVATLPPRSMALGPVPTTVVYGGFHIHSNRSDGTGTVDDIAAAASRAGLGFVVLTDHGDGTRPPEAPQYRHGVLCLDAVELNAMAGHVVAVGLSRPAPYPIAGETDGVIEDIHRQGGWAVIAHPDSPRASLAWHDWSAPYDGVEWLNADAEWRDESAFTLAGALARSLFRAPESVAWLFQRPATTLARWDAASRRRRVVGLAALDAHARLFGWREGTGTDGGSRGFIAKPTYEDMFRALSQAVVLDAPLSGEAAADAAHVEAALRTGRSFSIVRAMAWPASLEFSATVTGSVLQMGDTAPAGSPAVFQARVPEAPGARVAILCNGVEVTAGRGRVSYRTDAPTSCRVEVYYPGRSTPWIVSNAIALTEPAAPALSATASGARTELTNLNDVGRWAIERDATSTGALAVDGSDLKFSFALGEGKPAGQYAAMSAALDGSTTYDRVELTARADQPIRFWVQLRLPSGKDGLRWERSIYVDSTPRTISLPIKSFAPVDKPSSMQPVAVRLRSLLLVIDTVNSRPGRRGTIWLSAIGLAKATTSGR
jgi:hypothetical protein